jgi:prepilin-type N-terminal cleavage/methylation domain-containing protein
MSLQSHLNNRKSRGFTLIELLIVIAIILILIAIALPNFLEAQIRARVTRAKAEIRTLAISMEAYFLDWKYYPSFSFPNYTVQFDRRVRGLTWLTSPIAYITSLPEDPFPGDQTPQGDELFGPPYSYNLDGVESHQRDLGLLHPEGGFLSPANLKAWAIYSLGPDRPAAEWRVDHFANAMCVGGACSGLINSYSATNGTKSKGDIYLYGGDQRWMGVDLRAGPAGGDPPLALNGKYKDYQKPGQVVDGSRYLGRFPGHLTL